MKISLLIVQCRNSHYIALNPRNLTFSDRYHWANPGRVRSVSWGKPARKVGQSVTWSVPGMFTSVTLVSITKCWNTRKLGIKKAITARNHRQGGINKYGTEGLGLTLSQFPTFWCDSRRIYCRGSKTCREGKQILGQTVFSQLAFMAEWLKRLPLVSAIRVRFPDGSELFECQNGDWLWAVLPK